MTSSIASISSTASALAEGRALDIPFAAGRDEAIPRVFLVVVDVVTLGLAFVVAVASAPWVQWLLLPTGPLGVSLPRWLSAPREPNFDAFPALASALWMVLLVSPLTVVFMELLGGYRPLVHQSRARLLSSAVIAPILALSLLALGLFALKISDSSRVFVFTFGGAGIAALFTYRLGLWCYKRGRLKSGLYARNALVIGHAAVVSSLAVHFRKHVPSSRLRLVGWLRAQPEEQGGGDLTSETCRPPEVRQLGDVRCLGNLLIHRPIHDVIAVQPFSECGWLREVVRACDYFRVHLHIVPEALLVESLQDLQPVFRSDTLQLPEVVLAPPHFESDALFVKRLLDIFVSAMLMLLLAPLFGVIALLIKLTTPELPVFYPWRVVGLKGRQFTGYKFTTMVVDADDRKQELMALNEMSGPVFKIRNDPRVTRLGRFLRKYSLNELPQLWSVLKGDMSLVGPRPAGPNELARYELWHKRKLSVQPGITCLWQVRGRNGISDFDDWVRMDLEYIANWSLWLDFKILLRTVHAVFRGTGC